MDSTAPGARPNSQAMILKRGCSIRKWLGSAPPATPAEPNFNAQGSFSEKNIEMDAGRAKRILRRGPKLKCPDCGLGPLYRKAFRMHNHCEYCGLIYEREQGYFVGAIYSNVIATESLLLGALLINALITGNISQTILTVLIVLALVLPLVLFHHSRSLWLCVDYILNPSEKPIKHVDFESE